MRAAEGKFLFAIALAKERDRERASEREPHRSHSCQGREWFKAAASTEEGLQPRVREREKCEGLLCALKCSAIELYGVSTALRDFQPQVGDRDIGGFGAVR